MPLSKSISNIETSKESILVGRLTVKNENKSNHQPDLIAMITKIGGEDVSFTKPTLLSASNERGKDYIFSMSSVPGEIELNNVRFMKNAVLVIGSAEFNLNKKVTIPPNQIIYIGNITATIVPRKGDEPRAGSVIPIIDQAVMGFSTGTFEIDIKDNYNEDIAVLKKEFPYLADKTINKMVLPQWEYVKNQ